MISINRKKVENLKSITYSNNFEFIGQMLIDLKDKNKGKKSVLEKIKLMSNALIEMYFYTHNLEQDQYYVDKIIAEYRADKLRAIERARRAEAELEKYKKTYG